MSQPTCIIDGCEKPSRNKRSEALCKMHYHRQYRHGDTGRTAQRSGVTVSLGRRYKTMYMPGHPLASRSGRVYAHRFILFESIGFGPHACHWCATEIDWLPKGDPSELQPDHLNDDGGDNRLENLAPSCRKCNGARGSQRRAKALREAGWWSQHDTIAGLRNGGRVAPIDPAA